MGKKNNLNGVPGNLANTYFSTLKYYKRAYMSDWVNSVALKTKIYDFKVDILNDTVEPKACQIPALIYWNSEL